MVSCSWLFAPVWIPPPPAFVLTFSFVFSRTRVVNANVSQQNEEGHHDDVRPTLTTCEVKNSCSVDGESIPPRFARAARRLSSLSQLLSQQWKQRITIQESSEWKVQFNFVHTRFLYSFRIAARDLRRRGPLGYFRCECCTGGESVAAARMNRWLVTTHQRRARGCTAHKYGFFFGMTWPGIEPSLPALAMRAQSTRPFYAKIKTIIEMRSLKRGITATAW